MNTNVVFEGNIEPDSDPPQEMGSTSIEVTDEAREGSQVLKAMAMNSMLEEKFDQAISLLTNAIVLNPKSSLLFVSRAIMFVKKRKPNAAIRDANAAIKMNADYAKGYKARGMARAQLRLWDEAAVDLRMASDLDFDEETFTMLKKVEPKVQNPTELPKKYDNKRKLLRKFRLEKKTRQDAEAAAEIAAFFKDDQPIEEIIESDVEVDESKLVEPDVGPPRKMGSTSTEVNNETRKSSESLKEKALQYNFEENLTEAYRQLTKAIVLNPKSSLLLASRASILVKQEQPNAAIADADASLKINVDSAKSYKARGMAKAQLGSWEEAAKDLRMASNLDFDEEAVMKLKKVGPNAKKIEEHRRKYERLNKENERRKNELKKKMGQIILGSINPFQGINYEMPIMYEYNKDTKFGNMLMDKTQLPMYVIEECDPSLQQCLLITHPNQVAYRAYDKASNHMICETWDMTLSVYLGNIEMIGSFNGFLYLDPRVRKAFRDILTFVVDMNDDSFILEEFSIKNLVVKDGVVKFFNVGLKKSKAPSRKKNLTSVRDLLLGLLPIDNNSKPLPRDFLNFMATLKKVDEIGRLQAHSLLFHVCLMSPRSIVRFLVSIGDRRLHNETMAAQLLSVLSDRNCDFSGWNKKLDVQGLSDLKTCFEEENKKAKNQQSNYTYERDKDSKLFLNVNQSMCRCCRNLFVHAKIPVLEDEIVVHDQAETPILKAQVLILNAFMDQICHLQYRLCSSNTASVWFE